MRHYERGVLEGMLLRGVMLYYGEWVIWGGRPKAPSIKKSLNTQTCIEKHLKSTIQD